MSVGARGAEPAWRVVPVSHRFISFPVCLTPPEAPGQHLKHVSQALVAKLAVMHL